MNPWHGLTEAQKLAAVADAVEQITKEGSRLTGDRVGLHIGTTGRTGRTYLSKLLAAPAQSPQIALTEQYWAASKPSPLPLSAPAPAKPPMVTFQSITPRADPFEFIEEIPAEDNRAQVALVLPDWQVGMHDAEIIEKSLALAEYLKPDKIVHVGDESDCTAIGRWSRGTKTEWESNLQAEIDTTHDYLRQFREACPGAEFSICFSNHAKRFVDSIETRLPGFRTLRALTLESLYGLAGLQIEMQYQPFELFPDVIAAHGHQYGLTSAGQYQKGTQVVSRAGKSLVAGHTHRPVLTTVATGYNANMDTAFYLNVGCAMNFDDASYISSRQPEWGFGLGVIRHAEGVSYPELLMARGRNFYFEGEKF